MRRLRHAAQSGSNLIARQLDLQRSTESKLEEIAVMTFKFAELRSIRPSPGKTYFVRNIPALLGLRFRKANSRVAGTR